MIHKVIHVPTYLLKSRHGIFYFRLRVPSALREVLGRTEVRHSLRTGNLSRAGGINHEADAPIAVADSPSVPADPVPLPDRLRSDLGMVEAPAAIRDRYGERETVANHEKRGLDDVREPKTTEAMPSLGFFEQLKEAYDRTRASTYKSINRAISRIRAAFSFIGNAGADIEQQARNAEPLFERINECTRRLNQSTGSGGFDIGGQVTAPPLNDEPASPAPSWR